jgi:hypothetical protein
MFGGSLEKKSRKNNAQNNIAVNQAAMKRSYDAYKRCAFIAQGAR